MSYTTLTMCKKSIVGLNLSAFFERTGWWLTLDRYKIEFISKEQIAEMKKIKI